MATRLTNLRSSVDADAARFSAGRRSFRRTGSETHWPFLRRDSCAIADGVRSHPAPGRTDREQFRRGIAAARDDQFNRLHAGIICRRRGYDDSRRRKFRPPNRRTDPRGCVRSMGENSTPSGAQAAPNPHRRGRLRPDQGLCGIVVLDVRGITSQELDGELFSIRVIACRPTALTASLAPPPCDATSIP